MVEIYLSNGRNVTTTLRKWGSAHRGEPKPAYNTVKNIINKFETSGRLEDNLESTVGRRNSSRTPDIVEEAERIIEEDPTTSVRTLARDLSISKTSAHRVLREDLKKYPYKIQPGHELKEHHIAERQRLASEICELIDRKILDPMKLISSDEAHFHLCGYINKQNDRRWASERPSSVEQRPLHPQYTTVWAAISSDGVEDFQFIRNKKVNSSLYTEILEVFISRLTRKGKTRTHWFQQDGARAHTTKENLEKLRQSFEGRIISRRFPQLFPGEGVEWPPNSPDLSPMDFFVWGRVKDLVFKRKPRDLDDLEEKIGQALLALPAESCRRTFDSFEERLRVAVAMEGIHIEMALNKK